MLHSHAAENRAEVAAVRELTGRSNIAYLDDVGLTGADVVLAHGVHLAAEETQILARTGTRVCHCPGANLKLASGIADLPGLWTAGVVVGLGADGPPCNNRLSAFHEMSLAGTIHGLRHGPTAVDPWSVLAMVTRDGAHALNLESEIGTLEPGKAADLLVLGGNHWSLLPDGDPASRVVFGGSPLQVRHVTVAGDQVVQNGVVTTVDERELVTRVREAWRATRRRMEEVA
jgi:cytosine/adenosine deaminase-related metal-dependent hydrolase